MKYKNVVVAGGGVLGSQIAFQAAYCGCSVTIWLRSDSSITRCKPKLDALKKNYIEALNLMNTDEGKNFNLWCRGISPDQSSFNYGECLTRISNAYSSIKLVTNLNEAVKDADIVIESMAEDFDQKKAFYLKLKDVLEPKTVVVSNSSTLLPSKLAKFTGRSNMFLSLHFANSIWKNNIAEVMVQDKTDTKYFNEVIEFASDINMIPLPVKKEKAGYLLNSMLVPLLFSAMDLYVNGISDPESIDKAWTLGTGSPKGPFKILDTVGLTTAYNIVKNYVKVPSLLAPYNFKGMAKMLKGYIDQGKLGMSSGEGFYKYN